MQPWKQKPSCSCLFTMLKTEMLFMYWYALHQFKITFLFRVFCFFQKPHCLLFYNKPTNQKEYWVFAQPQVASCLLLSQNNFYHKILFEISNILLFFQLLRSLFDCFLTVVHNSFNYMNLRNLKNMICCFISYFGIV